MLIMLLHAGRLVLQFIERTKAANVQEYYGCSATYELTQWSALDSELSWRLQKLEAFQQSKRLEPLWLRALGLAATIIMYLPDHISSTSLPTSSFPADQHDDIFRSREAIGSSIVP